MNRKRQTLALSWLGVACVAIFAVLAVWPPTVGGENLNRVELTRSMDHLQAAERSHFYAWLGVDCVFALLYTVLFTWLLRWRAAAEASDGWSFAARFLSWITALAILFDLAENAILWAAASTSAARVSPWLGSLVVLKWLSLGTVVLYLAAWGGARWRARSRGGPR